MSQTTLNLTAMDGALKELYDQQKVQNLVYSDNPFLALLPKKSDFVGKRRPVVVQIGVSQGRSALFANAQANQTAATIPEFLVTRAKDYSIATIDNETMLASATDAGSFLDGATVLVDGALRGLSNSLASAAFRSGTGSIAAISSISTGVITLTNAADVVQFEVDMTLNANATDGGTPRAAKGYVIAVNRSSGTVTVSTSLGGSAASPSGWAAADFLLVDGDNNAKIKGLDAWLPATAPSSTAFFGVDRSVDTVRLGGVRYDGSAQSIEEALIDASSLVAREGGKPDYAIMNYASYAALEKALGAKVQYVDVKGPAEIAFRGVMINGANGQIKVLADRNCPAATCYLLQMNTWTLHSLGEAPMILRYGDDLKMLRVTNADSGEVRTGYYAQLYTNAPGWNARVTLSV